MYSITSTVPYTMIVANNQFLHNENINESNFLVELMEQIHSGTENWSLPVLNLNFADLMSNLVQLETNKSVWSVNIQ